MIRVVVQTAMAIAILWFIAGETQVGDELRWTGAVLGGLTISVILSFWFAWLEQPHRMYQEQRSRADKLEGVSAPIALYTLWDKKDPLTLNEAGCLWAGEEPSDPLPNGEARMRASELIHHAQTQRLEANTNTTALMIANLPFGDQESRDKLVKGTTTVSRKALRAYAESLGVRPLFLFPEDRNAAS